MLADGYGKDKLHESQESVESSFTLNNNPPCDGILRSEKIDESVALAGGCAR